MSHPSPTFDPENVLPEDMTDEDRMYEEELERIEMQKEKEAEQEL